MEASKLREWLQKLEPEGHGRGVRLAARTGLGPDYISKVLSGKIAGDVHASTLARVADHMHRDLDELMSDIFGGAAPARPASVGDVVVPLDAKYHREWEKLFRGNPARAKRVLGNLIEQERRGYTDLVSEIVALILEHGPDKAYRPIGKAIDRFEKAHSDSRKTQKKRRTT